MRFCLTRGLWGCIVICNYSISSYHDTERTRGNMPLPVLTHLQYLVLTIILINTNGNFPQLSGGGIRRHLKRRGLNKSGPAFYQMMKRIEREKWVVGQHEERKVRGYKIREKLYTITDKGYFEITEAYQFYQDEEFSEIQQLKGV